MSDWRRRRSPDRLGGPSSHRVLRQAKGVLFRGAWEGVNRLCSVGCRSHFAQPIVLCGRRELVSREPGTGKDEWGRERVSGRPGTGRMNGAWFMAGRRNDEGQRYCTTVVVTGRRCDATDGKVLEGDLGPAYQANFSIPFPAPGSRFTSSPPRPVQCGVCTLQCSMRATAGANSPPVAVSPAV
jgi:hypothetical protein